MKPGTSEEIVRSRRIKGVKMANSVLGRYDAVVIIEAKGLNDLKKIIYEMIEQHPNVVHTETLISIFYPP
ncbi:MAG: AsnC family transcriptional regulator [Candidatus Bathyarchaeota archaeon B26-1]|nr:MAG: AsnC family transcriptional regulator [Candidatus Bathyarchaeota archaeon B26-1]